MWGIGVNAEVVCRLAADLFVVKCGGLTSIRETDDPARVVTLFFAVLNAHSEPMKARISSSLAVVFGRIIGLFIC